MALRDLLAVLEEEGAAEHERVRAESSRRAAQTVSDARARAAEACADAVAEAEAAARQDAQTMLVEARTAARTAIREARDTALEAVRAQVAERLRELPGTPAGAAAARASLQEALSALERPVRVRVHPGDAGSMAPVVRLEVAADLTHGGAVAEDAEGRYVDNTYATRLANTWPELRADLSRSWSEAS